MNDVKTMTNRERALAVLRYEPYDRMPLVHFGYWHETLQKWAAEGHITEALAKAVEDGNPADYELKWCCVRSLVRGAFQPRSVIR